MMYDDLIAKPSTLLLVMLCSDKKTKNKNKTNSTVPNNLSPLLEINTK